MNSFSIQMDRTRWIYLLHFKLNFTFNLNIYCETNAGFKRHPELVGANKFGRDLKLNERNHTNVLPKNLLTKNFEL